MKRSWSARLIGVSVLLLTPSMAVAEAGETQPDSTDAGVAEEFSSIPERLPSGDPYDHRAAEAVMLASDLASELKSSRASRA